MKAWVVFDATTGAALRLHVSREWLAPTGPEWVPVVIPPETPLSAISRLPSGEIVVAPPPDTPPPPFTITEPTP